jgi:sensor histidine kinase YesM
MAEERMAVMMSQIGPHFIYNVLNSIYYLCRKDPEQAQTAVGEFAEYLRANLDGIEHKQLIPAQQELAHVRNYLNLEQMRFGEDLQVELDLQTEDFMIPPLTLQPLVENAVKHGVMKRETGGTVRLVTRREKDRTVVLVEDNGVGFDPDRIQEDGKVHIGIRNVRERLWNMCRATLEIDSRIGVGTEVRIKIPDQAAEG